VAKFKYSRRNEEQIYYHSFQNLVAPRLLSENVKIRKAQNLVLPFVLYGGKTWLLCIMEGHKLSVFETWALRNLFGPPKGQVTAGYRTFRKVKLHILCSSWTSVQTKGKQTC